jgi:hypothetical protein
MNPLAKSTHWPVKQNTPFSTTRNQVVLGLFWAGLCFYWILGALPITPLENDSIRIAVGAQGKTLYGNYTYAYSYETQVGAYKLIEIFHISPIFDEFRVFSYLSIAACGIFLMCSVFFVRAITKTNILSSLVALLLFQEIYISGYYPNSTILAAAFLATALLLATKKKRVFCIAGAASLFALSFWTRFDAILIGGVFLFLLWPTDRRSCYIAILFFLITISIGAFLFFVNHISLQNILESYATHVKGAANLPLTLNNYSTIFTFATSYFCGLGLYYLFQRKEWHLLVLTFVGTWPLLGAYGLALTSPKYLLYTVTLLAIPISYALRILWQSQRKSAASLRLIGIILFVGQYIFTPAYEVMFNRSLFVYTADEVRLRGAIAYTPVYWARNRRAKLIQEQLFQRKLQEHLQTRDPSYLISQDWMTNQWLLYFLQAIGYRIKEAQNYAAILEDGQRLVLTKAASTVYLLRWRPEVPLDLPPRLQTEIESMATVLYIGPDYTTTTYAQESFLANRFQWQRLPDWGRFETILFKSNTTK